MKKIFLIFIAVFGLVIIANAQDIILKKDGSEIEAKVIEITDQYVKYKDFNFQTGPIRNLKISEVFRITYENGKKEIFNKPNETNAQPSERKGTKRCYKDIAFGMDFGLGGSFAKVLSFKSETCLSTALGFRVMYHINPYLGVDFLKVNWITDVLTSGAYYYTPWTMRLQIMPGVRGNSPTFYRCMSGYAAFRLGYGMDFLEEHYRGFCIETEVGINFTPTIFTGFGYNYHNYIGYGFAVHTLSFRFGINIGK